MISRKIFLLYDITQALLSFIDKITNLSRIFPTKKAAIFIFILEYYGRLSSFAPISTILIGILELKEFIFFLDLLTFIKYLTL